MNLKMAQNSIFAILLRSSWWISAGIAALLMIGSFGISQPLVSTFFLFAAVPFAVIAAVAGWRQRNKPSAERIEQTTTALRAMSWPTFQKVLQAGLREDGCEIEPIRHEHAEFELRRKNRVALLSAKRWKASRVGVQALQGLSALRQARGAHEAIYVTTGQISEQAAAYAKANQILFMSPPELARLLPARLLEIR